MTRQVAIKKRLGSSPFVSFFVLGLLNGWGLGRTRPIISLGALPETAFVIVVSVGVRIKPRRTHQLITICIVVRYFLAHATTDPSVTTG
jgi:hypothetical protein